MTYTGNSFYAVLGKYHLSLYPQSGNIIFFLCELCNQGHVVVPHVIMTK